MAFLNRPEYANEQADNMETGASLFAPEQFVATPDECFFYHTMELPHYGVQFGGWDLRNRFSDYVGDVDVVGKRVLDVGSASGFLSFEAERYGASEVVSFDLDTARRQSLLPFAGSDYVLDHPKWCAQQTNSFRKWQNAYWLARRLLNSKTKVLYGDVYDLPAALGLFDVVIVGAILEHLIDPLSALFSLSRHVRDTIVINTDYLDIDDHMAVFKGRADNPTHSFVFWAYSIAVYDEYMKIMGFKSIAQHKNRFAGVPSAPGAERPMMERVALVYARDTDVNPVPDRIPERLRR